MESSGLVHFRPVSTWNYQKFLFFCGIRSSKPWNWRLQRILKSKDFLFFIYRYLSKLKFIKNVFKFNWTHVIEHHISSQPCRFCWIWFKILSCLVHYTHNICDRDCLVTLCHWKSTSQNQSSKTDVLPEVTVINYLNIVFTHTLFSCRVRSSGEITVCSIAKSQASHLLLLLTSL